MPDVFSKQKRSAAMSLIRSRGVTGWRRGSKLPGKPDFVFPKLRVALFVDGCFWHGCPKHGISLRQAYGPTSLAGTRAAFWRANVARQRGDGHTAGVAPKG